jgi:hypothetical protein
MRHSISEDGYIFPKQVSGIAPGWLGPFSEWRVIRPELNRQRCLGWSIRSAPRDDGIQGKGLGIPTSRHSVFKRDNGFYRVEVNG